MATTSVASKFQAIMKNIDKNIYKKYMNLTINSVFCLDSVVLPLTPSVSLCSLLQQRAINPPLSG